MSRGVHIRLKAALAAIEIHQRGKAQKSDIKRLRGLRPCSILFDVEAAQIGLLGF